jgi:hypothetical protein
MSYGMKTNLGICFQNSYGTSQVGSIYWVGFNTEGFAVAKDQLVSEAMTGVFDEGINYEGQNSNDGKMDIEVNAIIFGVALKAIMGSPSSVNSGGIYTHTFKPRTSDFDIFAANQPVTVVKDLGDTGSMHLFYDEVASKLSLSVANGEFLKASMEFTGGKYSQSAALAASFTSAKNFTWDVASVGLGGSANGDIKELKLELDEQLENHWTLNNQKTPSRTKRSGRRTLSVGGTIIFDSQTEYQKFISQTEQNMTVYFRGPTQIQSGYFETLQMIVPLHRYTEFKPVAGDAGKLTVPFNGKGVYSVTSATALHFILVNTQAAY